VVLNVGAVKSTDKNFRANRSETSFFGPGPRVFRSGSNGHANLEFSQSEGSASAVSPGLLSAPIQLYILSKSIWQTFFADT
jgi:hypothetical protein